MQYRILSFTDTRTFTYRIDDDDGIAIYQSATEYDSADEAIEIARDFIVQRSGNGDPDAPVVSSLEDLPDPKDKVVGIDALRAQRQVGQLSPVERRGLDVLERIKSTQPRFAFECRIETPLSSDDRDRLQAAGQQLVAGISDYINTLAGHLAIHYAHHPQEVPDYWR